MKKTAIILGASGLTGSELLNLLLKDDDYKKVIVFVRKQLTVNHQKLQQIICTPVLLEKEETNFIADEVFCCIGTTIKKTPNKGEYKNIDIGIPFKAAELCKKNGINTLLVISALGANSNSSFFYNRVKGEMEQKVTNLKIDYTYMLRPSFIQGNRKEKRLGELLGTFLFKLISPLLIGSLKKYRPIKAKNIAKTMIHLAKAKPNNSIILSDKITEIAIKNG